MDKGVLPSESLEDEEKQSTETNPNSEAEDRIDVELDRIRDRRENPGQSFLYNTVVPQTFDDFTLVFGLMAGLIFFGSISLASSGLIMGDSIVIDDSLSGTLLDPNDCVDKRGEIWIDTWVENDDLRIESHNVASLSSSAIFVYVWNASDFTLEEGHQTDYEFDLLEGGIGDLEIELSKEDLVDGDYFVRIIVLNQKNTSDDWSDVPIEDLSDKLNASLLQDGWPGITIKAVSYTHLTLPTNREV